MHSPGEGAEKSSAPSLHFVRDKTKRPFLPVYGYDGGLGISGRADYFETSIGQFGNTMETLPDYAAKLLSEERFSSVP